MSNKLAKRTAEELVSLAVEIREEHEACEHDAQSAVERAINCGRMLIEAKEKAGHGNFKNWVADNFPASYRTAANYMRLAQTEDVQRVAHLPIRDALAELAETRNEVARPAVTPEEEHQRAANALPEFEEEKNYPPYGPDGKLDPDIEAEEVDAEIVDDEPSPPTRSSRTDVVAVMGTVLLRAEEAATNAQKVTRAHLVNRPEAAATWARELSEHVSQLQRLLTLLEESNND